MKFEKHKTPEEFGSGSAFWTAFKEHHNLEYLGGGCCASVYEGKDCVYKVGTVRDNRAYLAYIKAIQALGSDNPFLPKIFGVRIVGNFMMVAMEKLSDDFTSGDFFAATGVKYWELEEFCELAVNGTHYDPVASKVKKSVYADLIAAAYVVSAAAAKRGTNSARFDMHSGNFMMRGKQVVITDPLCDAHI